MELKPGQRLRSAVCDANIVVVRAPAVAVQLYCGGAPMMGENEEPEGSAALPLQGGEGLALGKRYADDELGLEVLCTRPGAGDLTVNDRPLQLKGAKPLPSSD